MDPLDRRFLLGRITLTDERIGARYQRTHIRGLAQRHHARLLRWQ